MSSGSGYGAGLLSRRAISERSTSTILRQRHTANATAGNSVSSALVGPPTGVAWLIEAAHVTGEFQANPGGNDSAAVWGQIVYGGAPTVYLVGRVCDQLGRQAPQFGQVRVNFTLHFGEEVQLVTDAINATAAINGILTFSGWEFPDLVNP